MFGATSSIALLGACLFVFLRACLLAHLLACALAWLLQLPLSLSLALSARPSGLVGGGVGQYLMRGQSMVSSQPHLHVYKFLLKNSHSFFTVYIILKIICMHNNTSLGFFFFQKAIVLDLSFL